MSCKVIDDTPAVPDECQDVIDMLLLAFLPRRTHRFYRVWVKEGGLAEGGIEFPLLRTESPTFPRGQLMIVGVQLPPAQQVVPRGFDVFSGSGRGGKARIPEELHMLPKLEAVLGSGRLQVRCVVSPWVARTVIFAALGLAAPAGS
jgi:hypothetical protein